MDFAKSVVIVLDLLYNKGVQRDRGEKYEQQI